MTTGRSGPPTTAGRPPFRGRPGGGRRRYFPPRRRVCIFCVDKVTAVDYKDVTRLKRYISDRAKIDPRRRTGTCAKHQRLLAAAIKRARHIALLPFTGTQMRQTGWVHRSERPSPGFTRNAPPVEPQNVSSTESASGNESKTEIENTSQAVISPSENTPAETITEAPSSAEQPPASSEVEQETQNEPA